MNGDRRGMSKLHEAAPLDRRTNLSAEHHRAGPKATETGPKETLKGPLRLVPERCSFRVPSGVVSPAPGPAL